MPHTRSMHESDRGATTQNREPRGEHDANGTSHSKTVPPQNLTPSSTRPPPSHPILKKPRGPSSSGPRPTARFVDVPESEDDNAQQSSSSLQSASGASQLDNSTRLRTSTRSSSRARSPAKPDRKPTAGKKFVASTTTSKRRPVLPRRQSSQSSTGSLGSEKSARDPSILAREQSNQQALTASPQEDYFPSSGGSSGLPTHVEEPLPRTHTLSEPPGKEPSPEKPTIVKTSPSPDPQSSKRTPKRTPSPLSQGQNVQSSPRLSDSVDSLKRSAKALGKQPESTTGLANTPVASHSNPLGIYDSTAENLGRQAVANKNAAVEKPDGGKIASAQKTARNANPMGAPAMVRSKSNTESKRASSGPVPPTSFKSPSVVGMSKFAVSGGFDFEIPRARPSDEDLPPLGADQPDLRKSSVLDSKFSPTQPSSTPAPPMGRSKSQLTLLLERDKARVGDRHKLSSSLGGSIHRDDSRKKS